MRDFLITYPSEALIVSIQQEDQNGDWSQGEIRTLFRNHYWNIFKDFIYDSTDIPNLGQARGKIYLME